ncbi:hypothetical protein C3L33_18715, partial [Rhododendron williamsianum]
MNWRPTLTCKFIAVRVVPRTALAVFWERLGPFMRPVLRFILAVFNGSNSLVRHDNEILPPSHPGPDFLTNDICVKPDLDALGSPGDVKWYCIRAILWAADYCQPEKDYFDLPFQENVPSFYDVSRSRFATLALGIEPIPSEHKVATNLPQEALMVWEFAHLVASILEKMVHSLRRNGQLLLGRRNSLRTQ